MTFKFPDPPTYASPIEEDKTTKQPVFNPLWLQWFIDMAKIFTVWGFGGGVGHNALEGLQGGGGGEFYHLKEQDYRFLKDQYVDGIVLKDTRAPPHYWRVTINNSGTLVSTDIGVTPP